MEKYTKEVGSLVTKYRKQSDKLTNKFIGKLSAVVVSGNNLVADCNRAMARVGATKAKAETSVIEARNAIEEIGGE